MIINVLCAALLVEIGRGAYYTFKELRRSKRATNRLREFMTDSCTWDEVISKAQADKVTNPELYRRVPQSWMPKLYDKFTGE